LFSITALIDFNQGNKQKKALIDFNHTLIALLNEMPLIDQSLFFFFWWGLLHGPQQGPDRMKEKPIRLGKGKLLPKQKNPP